MTPELFQICLEFQGQLIEWENSNPATRHPDPTEKTTTVIFAQHRGSDDVKVFLDCEIPENFKQLKTEVLDQLELKLLIAAINSWSLIYTHSLRFLEEAELKEIIRNSFTVSKHDEKGWNVFNTNSYLISTFATRWEAEFFLKLVIQTGVYDLSRHRFVIGYESYLGLMGHLNSYVFKLFRKLPLIHRRPLRLRLTSWQLSAH